MSKISIEMTSLLTSPGFWDALQLYVKLHEKMGLVNLKFCPSQKKLGVKVVSKMATILLQSQTVFVIMHTVFCYVSILVQFTGGREAKDSLVKVGRTFLTFYFATLASCMLATSIGLSFRQDIMCNMINAIPSLEDRIACEFD